MDCTSIPETLIEAELFGHEKGAFTGADRLVVGKCELASSRTLFLDEIGEMPLPLQAKLLRFVQDRELERIGGRQVIQADVRVVATTHRDPDEAVQRGLFRKDLYYCIKVVSITLQALRERGGEDIAPAGPPLPPPVRAPPPPRGARDRSVRDGDARAHSWPGNIRELEHRIESAVVLCRGPVVLPAHLALPKGDESTPKVSATPAGMTPAEVEKRHILHTLEAAEGNRTRAAALLDIGRNTVACKRRQYGLE